MLSGPEPSYLSGSNVASVFSVLMRHNQFYDVEARSSKELDKEYSFVHERRLMRQRRDALDSKIEQTEVSIISWTNRRLILE